MGCLTTRSSPEAILAQFGTVCVCEQLFCAGSSLRSTAFTLGKILCPGIHVNYYSTSKLIQAAPSQGDLAGMVSLGKQLQHYLLKATMSICEYRSDWLKW